MVAKILVPEVLQPKKRCRVSLLDRIFGKPLQEEQLLRAGLRLRSRL